MQLFSQNHWGVRLETIEFSLEFQLRHHTCFDIWKGTKGVTWSTANQKAGSGLQLRHGSNLRQLYECSVHHLHIITRFLIAC